MNVNSVTSGDFNYQNNNIIIIGLVFISLIFGLVVYGMGGAFLAESFNLYTNYDGEILFEDSAMMNWKHAFLIGTVYYLLIVTAFYFLLKTMNLEGKQRNIHLKVLSVFNLLVCFGVGYLLSSPFIS